MKIKNVLIKIALTIAVILISFLSIYIVSPKNKNQGSITLIIEEENIVYNNNLDFKKGESLLDLLEKNFIIEKKGIGKQVIILSIKNNDFNIKTDFTNNFLAFYKIIDETEVLLEYGASSYSLSNKETILIRTELVWKEN